MRWLWRVLPPIHAGSECGKRGGEHRQGFRRRTPGVGVRCGYQMTPQAWQSDLPKPQGDKGLTLQQRLTGLCSDNQCNFKSTQWCADNPATFGKKPVTCCMTTWAQASWVLPLPLIKSCLDCTSAVGPVLRSQCLELTAGIFCWDVYVPAAGA